MNYYTEWLDVDGWRCFLGDSVELSARLCPPGEACLAAANTRLRTSSGIGFC